MTARILVACLTAPLRTRLFDLCAARDHGVDGVADETSLRKRLAKDTYAAVILETGVADPTTLGLGDTPCISVRAEEFDPTHFAQQLDDALAQG